MTSTLPWNSSFPAPSPRLGSPLRYELLDLADVALPLPDEPSEPAPGAQTWVASSFSTASAPARLDSGFWPVIRLPSTTTYDAQAGPDSNSAPA